MREAKIYLMGHSGAEARSTSDEKIRMTFRAYPPYKTSERESLLYALGNVPSAEILVMARDLSILEFWAALEKIGERFRSFIALGESDYRELIRACGEGSNHDLFLAKLGIDVYECFEEGSDGEVTVRYLARPGAFKRLSVRPRKAESATEVSEYTARAGGLDYY